MVPVLSIFLKKKKRVVLVQNHRSWEMVAGNAARWLRQATVPVSRCPFKMRKFLLNIFSFSFQLMGGAESLGDLNLILFH